MVTNGQSQPVSFTKEMTVPKFRFFKIAFLQQGAAGKKDKQINRLTDKPGMANIECKR